MNPTVQAVTDRIIERSQNSRTRYLALIDKAGENFPVRQSLGCTNLAHGFAACGVQEKETIKLMNAANVGIVTAYNDMLSAHQPYEHFPQQIKKAVMEMGCTAQVAGGVPAMCDGVTQGQTGMELSLFSRDQIAMSAAIALSHNMFDAALYLGVCDKIVPGLLIGALRFGHLPTIFVPAGPMPTGISNSEKSRVRQLFAEGKVSRQELLETESRSYHSAGTCTFYGTANSNQMLMEIMGLHLPGSSFVNPNDPLREKLTISAAQQVLRLTSTNGSYMPVGRMIDEKSFVNGMVGLLTTGGSTNLTMHIVAAAAAAGIKITWDDFSELSSVVPMLARVYPNGKADVNHFHAAGGLPFVIRELLAGSMLHEDVNTVAGYGLERYTREPFLGHNGSIEWKGCSADSLDEEVVRPVTRPFSPEGGLQVVRGNIGVGVIKVSAVAPENRIIEAPAVVFESQQQLQEAFAAGELNKDFVAVVRFQGPRANGMPELHKLTPPLGVLQDRGYRVALVTDGRMSGASGKVPAAIHVSPEASQGGILAKIREGDLIRLDAEAGSLQVIVDPVEFNERKVVAFEPGPDEFGFGRELFANMRASVNNPEQGATVFRFED
ncbi:phosphogluconate dehydratase [Gynuella sp.]|uniref:phosphogluconate dehydratase n=1 Tax=Gynuella sp. TaxID=2969146 RepID=UPI003D0C42E5